MGALGCVDRTVVEAAGRYGDHMRVEVAGAMDMAGVM